MIISRRLMLQQAATVLLAAPFANGALAQEQAQSVTAITTVDGSGQKLSAVAIDYGIDIDAEKLKPEYYSVEGRTIQRVYSNTEANIAAKGTNGPFVIIELSPADEGATLYKQIKRDVFRYDAKVTVKQLAYVELATGKTVMAAGTLKNSAVRNLVYEDFKQLTYQHPASGLELMYNLFVPKDYDSSKAYPLVNFMHDAGVTSENHDQTLVQGNGAISFASPEDQAKHPAFVLAPQFSRQFVNDKSEATDELDAVIDLIKELSKQYNIDQKRIYTTGQSGGGMLSIAMNIKYPDFFAASYLVACQWDPELIKPLANDKLWIVVSQGDAKAFPGQNAITAALESEGARVSRAIWDGDWSAEQFRFAVADLESEENPIKYAALRKGTVVPKGQDDGPGSNHVNTWRIAYSIEGIRDWLFRQSK